METCTSQKRKQIAVCDGYCYQQDRVNATGSVSLQCLEKSCSGRIKKNIDGVIVKMTDHTRAPNIPKIYAERRKFLIRDRASNTMEKPRQVIMQCTSGLSAEAASIMPKYTARQRTIERKRKREEVPLPTPRSLQEITVPAKSYSNKWQ